MLWIFALQARVLWFFELERADDGEVSICFITCHQTRISKQIENIVENLRVRPGIHAENPLLCYPGQNLPLERRLRKALPGSFLR